MSNLSVCFQELKDGVKKRYRKIQTEKVLAIVAEKKSKAKETFYADQARIGIKKKKFTNIKKQYENDPGRNARIQAINMIPLESTTPQERKNELFERRLSSCMEINRTSCQVLPKRQASPKHVRNLIKIERLKKEKLGEIINMEAKDDLDDLECELWLLKLFAKDASKSVLEMTFEELVDGGPTREEMTLDQMRNCNMLVNLLQGKDLV